MYDDHQEFLAWAAVYNHGDINMCNCDEWQKLLQCKQINEIDKEEFVKT